MPVYKLIHHFFQATGLFGLNFSLGIESSSDHLYVFLESLPQTSARTSKTTHMSMYLLSTKTKILSILGVLVLPLAGQPQLLVPLDLRREQKWVSDPSRISVYTVVFPHVPFLSWVITNLVITEGEGEAASIGKWRHKRHTFR